MPESNNTPKRQKRDWSNEGGLPYDKVPAFKAAYDLYKECQFRLRNVPNDAKPISRELKAKIMRVMVCVAHARLNVHAMDALREATDLSIETQITLRVLVETNSITRKDFAVISQYSDNLVRQMVGWSTSEEKKAKENSSLFPHE